MKSRKDGKDMGKGAMKGSIRDYFKKRGQRAHGDSSKHQKLSRASELKRRQWRAEKRAAERENPSYGSRK